jgi:squalene-hopene/tetraprenyl-beta-curcumene cyclase
MKIPTEMGVDELFIGGRHGRHLHLKWDRKKISWRNFFLVANQIIHFCERFNIRPLRYLALKRAEKWMLERFEKSDGLGAIYPGILNSIIALRCLGHSNDDPQVIRALDEFEKLGIDDPGIPDHSEPSFRMAPCYSPVWDTAYAMFALSEAGVSKDDPRLIKAADWILTKEVRCRGDWAVKVRRVLPGGWYFEFNNEFYPDVDDSAMVLLGLDKVNNPRERYQHEVSQRAIDWILAMQCKGGGWASFDKDNTRMVFQKMPFADHNAMLDPPTVDITGRVLEMLAAYGYGKDDPPVKKAIKFILKEQEADGSWFGRWGVNYIYGTMQVLRGLQAVGVDDHEPYVQQAAEWLRMVQNPDGGWGETCGSYDDPATRGIGPSTPSQTAWAVMGLLAAGDTRSDSVQRGILRLLETQKPNGTWDEDQYTGTGFPRVFYLAYHLYRDYFPLIALATYAREFSALYREGSVGYARG